MATKKSEVAKTESKAIDVSKIVVPEKLLTLFEKVEATEEEASNILVAFGVPLTEAGAILENYLRDDEGELIIGENTIVVTDAEQKDLIEKAKADRKTLKKIRTTVENDRKKMKEGINKQAQLIDGVARYIREEIEPTEKYLQLQEDFLKIQEEKAAAELLAARTAELAELGADPAIYSLHDMSGDAYNALLTTIKDANEAKAAREKAEAEAAAAKQRADDIENQRIRDDNARLQKEKEDREAKELLDRQAELAKTAALDAVKGKIDTYTENIVTTEDADETLGRLELFMGSLDPATRADDGISGRFHQVKTAILERKAGIIKAAEDKAAAEKLAAEKAAATAPDKEKLANFMLGLDQVRATKLPEVQSDEAKEIVAYINAILERTVTTVNAKIEAL